MSAAVSIDSWDLLRGRKSIFPESFRVPCQVKPQTYVFFLEIDGSPQAAEVGRTLLRAGALAESMTSLGTYPVRRRYKS